MDGFKNRAFAAFGLFLLLIEEEKCFSSQKGHVDEGQGRKREKASTLL